MTSTIDMVEQANARLIIQNPTTDQLCDRLGTVTEELKGAYQSIDRLRDSCTQALRERDEARQSRDMAVDEAQEVHSVCDADLEAQKRMTRNARRGEFAAAVAALAFAVVVIFQAFN